MAKCSVCVQARHLLEQNLTPEAKAHILADREEHLIRQQYVIIKLDKDYTM